MRTTISDRSAPCPLDKVNSQFHAPAPDMMWASDFTDVPTLAGFVYVAFVIDAFARCIAHCACRVRSGCTGAALLARRPARSGGLTHHFDRGSKHLSIRYTERLAEAGIEPSVGSVDDSYDNVLAETINGLCKAEGIQRRDPWPSFEAVEYATFEWVDWFNHHRLLEPIGNIPPAEAENRYFAMINGAAIAA